MAPIGLGEYMEEAKELLRAGPAQESISICRHILSFYPKYWAAYRLLGEVALEADDLQQAADLFRRVLGVDPEDIASYVALTVIFDSAGSLDEALWHLERAFELDPGNVEIRRELRRLYGLRQGEEPERIKLTPAALARLYLRGGLYERAIAELKPLVDASPQRMELKLALAEARWRDGQHWEAAEACQEILEELPHSLKSILILAKIWSGAQQPMEAQQLLRRAQEIDPENALSAALLGEDNPLPPAKVTIPRIGEPIPAALAALRPPDFSLEVPLPQARTPEGPAAEWSKEIQPLEEELPSFEEMGPPQATLPSAEQPPMAEEAPLLAEEVPWPSDKEPPWLKVLERAEGESEAPEPALPESEAAPSWLEALQGPTLPEEPAPTEEAPPSEAAEWLAEMEEPALVEPPAAEVTPPPAEAIAVEEVAPAPELAAPSEPAPAVPALDPLAALEARLSAAPQDRQARLAAARTLRDRDQLTEALAHYRRLVHAPGPLAEEVLADLSEMMEARPDNILASQLLGDAYLKAGRLSESMEIYRRLRTALRLTPEEPK